MSATSLRAPEPNPQTRPRVLIADDSRVIRMAIKKILGADYDLVEVADGQSAWDRIREDTEIQALVTDIEMPNVDGYELLCRIRGAEDKRFRDLPVIAITGAEDEETKQRAFACGATDFIIKPIDAIQLKARVQAYIRYDQTAREQTERSEILEDQSIVDSMTGLCSRRYLSQRGEQDLAFSIRRGNDLSLVRLDIDDFKKLYKTHGDDISEDLLSWFAKALSACARTEDTVARIGGTQFAILASSTSIANAVVLCKRLQDSLASQPYRYGKSTIPITLSMGMASVSQDRRDNFEDLLKLAQQRLCHAQSEGGNRVCSSVLSEMDVIEEVLAPSIDFQEDKLPTALDPLPDSLSVDSSEYTKPNETKSQEPEYVLDIIGMEAPEVELEISGVETPEVELSVESALPAADLEMELNAELAPVDALTNMGMETESSSSSDVLSIDRALQLIANGQGNLLSPNIETLLKKIQPLVDYATKARHNTIN